MQLVYVSKIICDVYCCLLFKPTTFHVQMLLLFFFLFLKCVDDQKFFGDGLINFKIKLVLKYSVRQSC